MVKIGLGQSVKISCNFVTRALIKPVTGTLEINSVDRWFNGARDFFGRLTIFKNMRMEMLAEEYCIWEWNSEPVEQR